MPETMIPNALAPVQAFQAGREMRTTARVGEAMAGGDMRGAQRAAFQGGNLQQGQQIGQMLAQMSEQERAQAMQRAQGLGQIAQNLQSMPYEQRRQVLGSPVMQQQLADIGVDPNLAANFDPTDENIAAAMAPVAQIQAAAEEQTSAMREYNLARQQGFEGTFMDFDNLRRSASRQQVSVNTGAQGPQIGSIPQGFQLTQDPQTGAYRMEAIPGGPVAMEAQEAERRQEGRQEQLARAGGTVIQDINRALGILERSGEQGLMSGPAAGPFSGQFREVPGTPAFEIRQLVESALSNVGLDTLQQMRENSPTGGALGQVPIQQQQRLEQVLGSLDVRQRPEVLRDNLNRVSNIYMDIVYGTPQQLAQMRQSGELSEADYRRYSQRAQLSFDEFGRPVAGAQTRGAPRQVSNDAEYDALPSGAQYVGPDGIVRRKP